MTEEEKKAINNLNFIIVTDVYDNEVRINKTEVVNEYNESVGIVLNLIQKQDTEINKLKNVIERMAKYIEPQNIGTENVCDKLGNCIEDDLKCNNCIKEYFMKEERRGEYE